MNEKQKDSSPNISDEKLEQEILRERKFSPEEAVARQAGKDLLKGASPVTQQRKAGIAIERFLDAELLDSEGALAEVLLRQTREGEALFKQGYERPLAALRQFVEAALGSESVLQRFVTEVDAHWGRMYFERPHFQQPGEEPDADDPYTFASVRAKLERLLEKLNSASES